MLSNTSHERTVVTQSNRLECVDVEQCFEHGDETVRVLGLVCSSSTVDTTDEPLVSLLPEPHLLHLPYLLHVLDVVGTDGNPFIDHVVVMHQYKLHCVSTIPFANLIPTLALITDYEVDATLSRHVIELLDGKRPGLYDVAHVSQCVTIDTCHATSVDQAVVRLDDPSSGHI